jgi:hypothetical protein
LPLNLKDGSAFFTFIAKLTALSFKLFSIPDNLSFLYVFDHDNRSAFVTSTVDEYLSDEVASDSEDQKRIRAAENTGVKKIKTSKKDDKQRGKRRPAEAAGAITQTTHNDGSSISSPSYQIQPFRAAGACDPAPHNISIANDSCHNCGYHLK